jgi:hypothetical protein
MRCPPTVRSLGVRLAEQADAALESEDEDPRFWTLVVLEADQREEHGAECDRDGEGNECSAAPMIPCSARLRAASNAASSHSMSAGCCITRER